MSIAIFPKPQKAVFRKRRLDLSTTEWIRVDPALSAQAKAHVAALADEAQEIMPGRPQVTAGEPNRGRTLLSVSLRKGGIGPQGYTLSAGDDGIGLSAADEAGVFYGLCTLRQILRQTGATPPAFEIADHPDFLHRGVMLDVSRCKVPKMETLFALVDVLAGLKINQFQLYMEHTFAFSEHEAVWHDASPITAEEILRLDAYCRERYVELVPNLNSFGHFGRWLQHPEYSHLAECPDGFEYPWGGRSDHGSVLRPNRNSLRLLDSLYREFLPNFSSHQFNVGCDETWELGRGWSSKLCEQQGSTRVYVEFLKKIHRLVRKHDRTMMFWGDIILKQPELIPELPDETIALEWGYEWDHDFAGRCPQFQRAGVPFYVCPGTGSWQSLTGRTANCLGNLSNAARNGLRHGAVGYLNTDWGDGGHHQYLPVSYTGFAAGAAYSWCLKSNARADVADALNRLIFRDATGVTGGLFLELGKVLELVPKRFRNCSVFNSLLFSPIRSRKDMAGITAAQLRACVERFAELAARIADARPDVPDAVLIKAEFGNALAMARNGARRGLLALGAPGIERDELRHELQSIISRHESLWLARNRPGGLRESSSRLRKALENLR